MFDIGKGLSQLAGAIYDPINISGYGGIPGVNGGNRGISDLGRDLSGANARDAAIDAQRGATMEANSLLRPYSDAGMVGMSGLQNRNILEDYQGDPGYQFRLDEGNKAINAAAAARGMGNSGATMKALARYGQDYASNEYNNAYNREFGRLSTLAGIGGNAVTGMANNIVGMGNANAAARIAQSNQQNNLLGQGMGIGAMALFSDERLKKDIELIPADEIHELRANLKPYLFKYISEEYGEGQWPGVMAQDLEKSKLGRLIVFENEKGEKQIDIKKAICLLLAMYAEGY